MKKQCLIILALLPIIIYAGTITKTLSFSEQDLNIQQINEYNLVNLKGLPSYQTPGAPIVPVAVYNILIPSTAEVTEIKVVSQKEYELPGRYYLYPSQEPKPISYQGEINFTNPDPNIYNSSQVYPAKLTDFSSTGTKSGYRICSFAVYPIRYSPVERRLNLVTNLTLEIIYDENKVTEQFLTERQRDIFSQDVKSIVINPNDIGRFAPPISFIEDNEIDCVIITGDAFVSNFSTLVEWHNKKGFRTEVIGTSTISSGYTGRDLQEKIRNFIINYFNTRGLKWVILAGDNAIVPARQARTVVNTNPPTTGNIPSDLYYADLQWSWDGNNNSVFGEAGYDTVDFFADVYVGRASVDNATEINTFITKIFTYEKNPDPSYLKKMLLPAATLWDNYNHVQSQDSIANISPTGWIDRVIDQGTNTSLRYQVRDSLNAGFGLVHLVGHGDNVGVYISSTPQYYYTDPATQTNYNKLAIVNSIACYPGNFEYNDCLAEAMMNAQGCAVAVMMCSRYGWGTPPTIGPSELLDVRFWDFFFNQDSCLIGSCHSSSKDAYRYMAENQQVWRWCVYELNLFGNPLMPMWSDVPYYVQITRPDTIQTGPRSIQVQVFRAGLPANNILVGVYKPGEVYARGRTDVAGHATITINALTPGTIYITATGKNCYPAEDSVAVVMGSASPYIVLDYLTVGQINPNETVNMNAAIRNIGTASATNVSGIIRTNNSYITMIDSISNYGTVPAGATTLGDPFTFYVASNTPLGTQIPFTLNITADQGSWSYNFNLQVGTPIPPGQIIMNHDTGYCLLSVTALGSIGYTEPLAKTGSGFRYPKAAISALYYSSMMAGNSATYLVDRFYGQPATTLNQDWRVVDSLRFITPPEYGDQHLRCSYNDAGHSTPLGLKVTQNSYMSSTSNYDDFVVIVYDYQNTGTETISGLYSGIIADFDMPPDSSNVDVANSDATRRLVYMRRAANQNPTVGIKLLSPTTAQNLTCIDHDRYVYPDSAMTESMKYRILNGGISLAQSNRTYDWSVALSTTPFNLTPSQSYRVAYAFVGGSSEAELFTNADAAQIWYNQMSGISDEDDVNIPGRLPNIDFKLIPNPSTRPLRISYNIPNAGNMTIGLYDIAGQLKIQLFQGMVQTKSGVIEFNLKDLPNGVYFVKLATDKSMVMKKFLLVK